MLGMVANVRSTSTQWMMQENWRNIFQDYQCAIQSETYSQKKIKTKANPIPNKTT